MSRTVSDEINKNLIDFIQTESKEEQTRFLGTNSYTISPYDKTQEIQNVINLGAEFVLKTMGNGEIINEDAEYAIKAVKNYLKTIRFVNKHELDKNTADFLFKTAYCAPSNYIRLLKENGLDINAKRCHPFYTNIEGGQEYPLLFFAMRQGNLKKIEALIDNGADTSCAGTAIAYCQDSKVLPREQAAAVFNLFKSLGISTAQKQENHDTREELNQTAEKATDRDLNDESKFNQVVASFRRAFGYPRRKDIERG